MENIMRERNAIIESADLNTEDFGVLTLWLMLKYDGGGQGFGGYCLYNPHEKNPKNYAGLFIYQCMRIAGVEHFSKMVGKAIRVRIGDDGKIKEIGHIIEDKWFDPMWESYGLEDR